MISAIMRHPAGWANDIELDIGLTGLGFTTLAFSVVEPLTEREIRAAFVNCSKGEAKRLHVPRDLAEQPWDDLDFLGWRDPRPPTAPTLSPTSGRGPWPSRCALPSPGRSAPTSAPSA